MISEDEAAAISAARQVSALTRRPTVPDMEALLFEPFDVLDHGFVRVVDYMGDDAAIVQAARVSYGTGTRRVSEDRGLIHYLMRHAHTTPFEMCEIKFHVKLPIFVARQWIRHRMASVNEYSARYSVLDKEFYIPAAEHLAGQSKSNRQGRDAALDAKDAQAIRDLLRDDADRAYEHYVWMLNETPEGTPADPDRQGLSRELARINLGLGTYTQWYWKVDLHNLLRFLRLRADPHAQLEIRLYAEAMLEIVRRWVPLAHEAFLEHQVKAATFSGSAMAVVRRMVAGEKVDQATSGLSLREWEDLATALDLHG